MQKVFNAISLLTFIVVGAQVAGVVYLASNQDSIKQAIINEAVAAVTDSIGIGKVAGGIGGLSPAAVPATLPTALPQPEVGKPAPGLPAAVPMFMP